MCHNFKKIADFLKKKSDACTYLLEDGIYYMVCDGEKIPVDYVRFNQI